MKIIHHERKQLASHFSIERLFAEIRRHMASDVEVTSCEAPYASSGFLSRVRNVMHAAKQRGDVHHIVGDSHYLAFGLPGKRTVLTIHDCAALDRLTGLKRAILKYFWFTGPMRRAAVVTTISQTTKDELRKWVGPLADKVVVVPDCVFEEFTYDPKPFNEAAPAILQVGTKWNKNLERVMEALRGTRCRLEIVGSLPQTADGGRQEARGIRHTEGWPRRGAKRHEEDKRRDEKTEGRRDDGTAGAQEGIRLTNVKPKTTVSADAVCELGRLTDDELVAAYRRCDMVIFASLYEGFGLPILEAQATGRPVITSNISAMPEAAGEGALFVDPYSVESIRAAVLRIKNEPTLREDLVRKGLENVARFRPAVVAARYAEIYREF